MTQSTLPATLGELKESKWQSRSLKQEIKDNLILKIQNKEPVFDGIIGYETTVLPQVQNAIFSKHDFILLGLRGQAKTQLIRKLPILLDEFSPSLSNTQLNEDPYHPISPKGKLLVKEQGDNTPITWRHRHERFNEKLATPDVSMNDLIGDIDPIKAAREKLDISNPDVIHWGIIPRTNRGIFAINEVPDLQPRIQVGLLNILEESDIQVRGFPIRLPLDVLLVFTANPEDYTNRGTIITPLKDRIDSQIITHYPSSVEEAKIITHSQSKCEPNQNVPEFLHDIIEEIAFQARRSEYVDQTSGVSSRLSISALENFYANIERRAIINGIKDPYPRMMDLYATLPAITGKIELVHEGDQAGSSRVAMNLVGLAINTHFLKYFPDPKSTSKKEEEKSHEDSVYSLYSDFFSNGGSIELSENMSEETYQKELLKLPRIKKFIGQYLKPNDDKEMFIAIEFFLEGLHHNQIISRKVEAFNIRFENVYSNIFKGFR